jgi:hypothetical protein
MASSTSAAGVAPVVAASTPALATAATPSKPARASGVQLKEQLAEVRKSIETINTITLALIKPEYNITIGDHVLTRSELKRTMQANDKVLAQIASQVGKGVRKRLPGSSDGSTASVSKGSGGLSNPNIYSQELVAFFSSAQLGKLDPAASKSEDVAAIVKRSVLGKHGIATSPTISRLMSILISVNQFKSKQPGQGQTIVFPQGYLEKWFPNALDVLKKSNALPSKWTFINLSALTAACMVKKSTFTQAQQDLIAQHTDGAVALDQLCADLLARQKTPTLPPIAVPAALAAPANGGTAAGRGKSPTKNTTPSAAK